jgi:hypothetical protein
MMIVLDSPFFYPRATMKVNKSCRFFELFLLGAALLTFQGCNAGKVNDGASGGANNQEDLLQGIVSSAPPDTPETLAAKKTKLAENLALARDAAAKGEKDQAIALLEESLGWDAKHREVLKLLIETSCLRSKEVRTEDPLRCYQLIVQAGGYIKTLKETYNDLSQDEHETIASVMFEEACAHARSQRQEEFSGALNAAIDAGFSDLDRLNSEPDLDAFRKVPAMDALIRGAAESISKVKK